MMLFIAILWLVMSIVHFYAIWTWLTTFAFLGIQYAPTFLQILTTVLSAIGLLIIFLGIAPSESEAVTYLFGIAGPIVSFGFIYLMFLLYLTHIMLTILFLVLYVASVVLILIRFIRWRIRRPSFNGISTYTSSYKTTNYNSASSSYSYSSNNNYEYRPDTYTKEGVELTSHYGSTSYDADGYGYEKNTDGEWEKTGHYIEGYWD